MNPSGVRMVTAKKLERAKEKLEPEEKEEEERYWCPYCGRPMDVEKDYIRGWDFHSPKGGAYFKAKIYKCPRCKKKVRVTVKKPGLSMKEEEE